jgi:hypothetical protein
LGSIAFDAAHTTVREKYEEVGGRNERTVEISGAIVGESSVAAVEAKLDSILAAASTDDYTAELSIRSGRRLFVKRSAFAREVSSAALAGSFVLSLGAREPYEESTTLTSVNWSISASGATKAFTSGGNVSAPPTIRLTATGSVVEPAFSDGTRTIVYSGTVANGSVLVFDAGAGKVTLDNEDVTPYAAGLFPRLAPGQTTLTYTDAASSSHTASVTVEYQDRWW